MILFALPEEGGVGVETTLWLCSMREIAPFWDIRALEQMPELLKSFSHLNPIPRCPPALSSGPSSPCPLACAFQVSFQCRKIGFLVQNCNVIVLFFLVAGWYSLSLTFKGVLMLNWIWDGNSSWCFCVQWGWLCDVRLELQLAVSFSRNTSKIF